MGNGETRRRGQLYPQSRRDCALLLNVLSSTPKPIYDYMQDECCAFESFILLWQDRPGHKQAKAERLTSRWTQFQTMCRLSGSQFGMERELHLSGLEHG